MVHPSLPPRNLLRRGLSSVCPPPAASFGYGFEYFHTFVPPSETFCRLNSSRTSRCSGPLKDDKA
jgi:hypothetical protein